MADTGTNNNILTRTAPHNLEAEKSVIGCMLMDREAVEAALGMLTKEDFYSRQYALAFEAIRECYGSMSGDRAQQGCAAEADQDLRRSEPALL